MWFSPQHTPGTAWLFAASFSNRLKKEVILNPGRLTGKWLSLETLSQVDKDKGFPRCSLEQCTLCWLILWVNSNWRHFAHIHWLLETILTSVGPCMFCYKCWTVFKAPRGTWTILSIPQGLVLFQLLYLIGYQGWVWIIFANWSNMLEHTSKTVTWPGPVMWLVVSFRRFLSGKLYVCLLHFDLITLLL